MSLDDGTTQESQPTSTTERKFGRRAIIIALVALALITGVSIWYVRAQLHDESGEIRITSIGGTPVKDDEVTVGDGGWITWRPARFTDNKSLTGVPSNEELRSVIKKGLGDIETLKTWQLCEAELLAQSKSEAGWAKAYRDFPRNMPYNDDPAKSEANAVKSDENAQLYATAAKLAATANIACTPPGGPTKKLRFVTFDIKSEGLDRTLAVSDYDVIGLEPLEYQIVTGNTVTKERTARAKTVKQKVDKTEVMYAYSEQTKAGELASHDARLDLLAADPATNK